MKCYTLQAGGKLKKNLSPKAVIPLLDKPLLKRKVIATAYLDFVPLPFITIKEAMARKNGFSYGNVSLRSKLTAFQKEMKFTKTTVLVLYKHSEFYPDRLYDETSRDVWMDKTHCLLLGMEGKLHLREIDSGLCYCVRDGKLTKCL